MNTGLMERGRWYATLVPLIDGRLTVIAGFVGFDAGYPEMYSFENNNFVEFFDPQSFKESDPQRAWQTVDVKSTLNGPFTNLIQPTFRPTPGVNCTERCTRDNQYDAFKLYEQAYLTAEGRIYLTREGDFVSARTPDTAFMRNTAATYHMHIRGTRQAPAVSFSPGPVRPENITSYGTTLVDPNSNRIVLIGGQPTSPGTFLYRRSTRAGNQAFYRLYSNRHRLLSGSRKPKVCWRPWQSKTRAVLCVDLRAQRRSLDHGTELSR